MEPVTPKPRILVTLDERRRVVVASPALSEVTDEQAQDVAAAVRHAAEGVLTGRPIPCPTCEERAAALRETRYVLAAATWSLIDTLMWGGRVLDTRTVAFERIAEGLLDRVGEVVSHLTSKRIGVWEGRSLTLTDLAAPPDVHGQTPAEASGLIDPRGT